jgi:saccharopine dehydrogenase-like NADP-dependent oxidoreductase
VRGPNLELPMKILLLGSGKIGRMITRFLTSSGDFDVTVADSDVESLARLRERIPVPVQGLDASDAAQLARAMQGHDGVISALSYRFNPLVAQVALEQGAHYFDLTEDVETTRAVRRLAANARPGQLFVPQCGLAPGFVSIAAHALAQQVERIDTVHMRVGALPQFPTNALKYNLTWSTDGLINEYCNPCEAIHEGAFRTVLPLEGYEQFSLDGVRYEAFNTSGGLGTLCETLDGKVRELDYKTIRYLGHRDLAAFLVNELRLSEHREQLKELLERAVPMTFQDVVVVFCTVSGWRRGQFVQLTDARKVYHQELFGENWSAIQITTAAGICAVVDLVREQTLSGTGMLRQEEISLQVFLDNRFGSHYASGNTFGVHLTGLSPEYGR